MGRVREFKCPVNRRELVGAGFQKLAVVRGKGSWQVDGNGGHRKKGSRAQSEGTRHDQDCQERGHRSGYSGQDRGLTASIFGTTSRRLVNKAA